MHSVDARDLERIADTQDSTGCQGDVERLEAVVHVGGFTRACGRGRSRGVVLVRAVDVDVTDRGGVAHDAVGIVHLVGLEASNLTDERTLIGGGRLARHGLTASEIRRHAVIRTRRQRQITVEHLHALLVEHSIAFSHIRIAAGRARASHDEGGLSSSHVHDGDVDVRSKFLLCGVTKAAFLKLVTQFQSVQSKRHGLVEAERCRDSKLREVNELSRDVGARCAVDRGRNVGLRTPDHVVGAFHHRAVGVVHRHVARHYQSVVEAFEDVLERYALFFTKRVRHFSGPSCVGVSPWPSASYTGKPWNSRQSFLLQTAGGLGCCQPRQTGGQCR